MGTVASDEELCSDRLLARRSDELCAHPFGVLAERRERYTPIDGGAHAPEVLGEDPFGLVLGQRDELEGHRRRKLQHDVGCLLTVDEDLLAPHRGARIERIPQHPGGFPDLQGPRLDPNRLRHTGRGFQSVDDSAPETASP